MTSSEKANLDWIVNRMHGRAVGTDGTWHATVLPESESEDALSFQIGTWDSRISPHKYKINPFD